jgi:bifunctional isochorismate lyase/aryl carrier protein
MPTDPQPGAGPPRWRPDPLRAALLIHDMQRYFLNFFPPGRSPTTELIANTVQVRETARSAGLPVIYSAQPGGMSRAERGLLHDIWGPGMTDDPDDREIIAELTPGPHDFVLTKYRYSAFFRTGLAALLSSLGRDQLIVCGVFAHIGCLFTAGDAFSHDIEAFLLADAVADFSLRDHLMALDYAGRRCAVTMTTDQLREALPPIPPHVAALARRVPPATSGRTSGRSAEGDS